MPREKATPTLTRKCPVCSGKFNVSSERSLAVYCSNACKQQAYLAKAKNKNTTVTKSKPAQKQTVQPVAAPVSKPAPKQKQPAPPPVIPPFSTEEQAELLHDYYNLHDEEVTIKKIAKLLKKFEKHLDRQDDWIELFETAYDDLIETYEHYDEDDRFTFECADIEELEEFLEEMGLIQ